MGRNWIPKLGEWRDGKLHQIGMNDGSPFSLSSGHFLVYTVKKYDGPEEILACCHADGADECLASFWRSGYDKGLQAGVKRARAEMRAALGITKSDDAPSPKGGA